VKNTILDVGGLRIGQAHDARVKTGVTVILPDAPATCAVDVRGGGPGTRETDTLADGGLIEQVHAICLAGGSVYGLAAADGVCAWLGHKGIGYTAREGIPPSPIVPSAILFDNANGGDKEWGLEPPFRALGIQACEAASHDIKLGAAGAGFGATAGKSCGPIHRHRRGCDRCPPHPETIKAHSYHGPRRHHYGCTAQPYTTGRGYGFRAFNRQKSLRLPFRVSRDWYRRRPLRCTRPHARRLSGIKMIGPILNSHHAKILRINQDFVHWLSPLDEGALTDLLSLASYKKQIHEADGVLIGYAHNVNYDHKNLTERVSRALSVK